MTTQLQTLILASSSPRRQELIRSLGLPVEIYVNDVDETVPGHLGPSAIVETLSLRKAEAAAERVKEAGHSGIIIGSDTIVALSEHVLGKPRDKADAARMLQALQGSTHEVYSGVACIDTKTGDSAVRHRLTRVSMKRLTAEQIERYIATGEPMDKAGAYAIQGLGATIVDHIEGDYFNVVGLPLSLLSDMLRQFDIHVI
jgi:septum formation protein